MNLMQKRSVELMLIRSRIWWNNNRSERKSTGFIHFSTTFLNSIISVGIAEKIIMESNASKTASIKSYVEYLSQLSKAANIKACDFHATI